MIEKMLQINNKSDKLTDALGLDEEKMLKEISKMAKEMIKQPKVTDIMNLVWSNNDYTLEEQVFLTYTMGKLTNDPVMAMKAVLGLEGKCNCEKCKEERGE